MALGQRLLYSEGQGVISYGTVVGFTSSYVLVQSGEQPGPNGPVKLKTRSTKTLGRTNRLIVIDEQTYQAGICRLP